MRRGMVTVGLVAVLASGCQTAGQTGQGSAPASTTTAATEPMSGPTAEPVLQQQAKSSAAEQAVPPAATGTADAELVFLDFSGFDEDLSREMLENEERIVVDVPAAFSLNAVPGRLDKWFAKIKDTGGYVQAREAAREDAQRTRGIVGALIDLAVAAYEAQEAEELLEPAGGYNVLIEYDKQSGNADQVVFYRR